MKTLRSWLSILSEFINKLHSMEQLRYFPKASNYFFLLIVVCMCFKYNYNEILFYRPQSIHQWRQCDCLSLAANYYQENSKFFQPSMHYLGRDGSGKTISDFPLIYYFVGNLWKVFGCHEFIYRLLVLLIFIIGLFSLFKVCEDILKDSLISLIIATLYFSSPTIVYYANNFLMDIPALSFACIGTYFFLKFYRTAKDRYLYLFAFSFLLAGLLKVSSLLLFFSIGGIYILEIFNIKINPDRKVFARPFKQVFPFILVGIAIVSWYFYAKNYNSEYNGGIFLVGILPIWDIPLQEIKDTLDGINNHIKHDYFMRETQITVVLMFLLALIFYKKVNRNLLLLCILTFCGFLLFTLFFFQALKFHDYYVINLTIFIPLIVLTFFKGLKTNLPVIFQSFLFRILLIVCVFYNISFASENISGRYAPEGWQNAYYVKNIKDFGELSTHLDSFNIKKDDRVLVLSDNSINITLYFLNRKGWTNYGVEKDSNIIRKKIALGAKYLLFNDSTMHKNLSLTPFMKNKIVTYKSIEIYKLPN